MSISVKLLAIIVAMGWVQPILCCAEEVNGKSTAIVEISELIKLIQKIGWDRLDLTWHANEGDHYVRGPQIILAKYRGEWSIKYRERLNFKKGKEIEDNWEHAEIHKAQIAEFVKELAKYMSIAADEIDFFESLEGLTEDEREEKIRKTSKGFGIGWIGYSLKLKQGNQTLEVSDKFSESMLMRGWMLSLSPNKANK